jgi:type III secretion protein L
MSSLDIYEIKPDGFDLKQCGKIMKANSYATLVDCRAMLSAVQAKCKKMLKDAQSESERIVAAAKAEAESILQEAKETKKAEEERGYEAGMETGKQEIANVMMDFVTKSANSFSKLENDVTDVVKMALRKIIGKLDKMELITSVVKNSLQKVKTQKQATLKVAPTEAQVLRDRIADLTRDTPMLEFLDICADAHLQPGSCIIETELGVIDASVPVQLEAVENALAKIKS